ncbi:MAG: DNA polymerase III subunit delta' [Porphyromonadaceae bacterium]|nr:DNA polymerase III subunit delta' [Porphyromonadaceae bacterium]
MFFRDIIGQDEVKSRLIQSVRQGRIAHAQLFEGVDGAGALPLALAYARYIQCTRRTADDACGECPSCRQISLLMHPDVHFVFPIKKQRTDSICDDFLSTWRDYLGKTPYPSARSWQQFLAVGNSQPLIYVSEAREIIRKLNLKSYESENKTMIIWQDHLMNSECANAILKMLEEPYEKTLFLLISDKPENLLETIRSRTQRIKIPFLSTEAIASALQRGQGLDAQTALAVAHTAGGDYLKALETVQLDGERQDFFKLFVSLMRQAYARQVKELKKWSEEVAALGREGEKRFIGYCQQMVRESFIYNQHRPELSYTHPEEEQFLTRFAPFINAANVEELVELFRLAERDIAQNANGKILFFDVALQVTILIAKGRQQL